MGKKGTLIAEIKWQIEPVELRKNYFTEEMRARRMVRDAAVSGDEIEMRSAMGQVSGLRRRWVRFLIVKLTILAFDGKDTSREKIRKWQKGVFAQSISSKHLDMYGKTQRSGGGRSSFEPPAGIIEEFVKKIFDDYKDSLRKM